MANTTYRSTEILNLYIQNVKGKTKINFYQSQSIYHDEMNFVRRKNV